ncbi:MAG: biopolymer transporter ExbD [Gammaproteobacteria bacterium]|jgi:biopolymer transport protein TolR
MKKSRKARRMERHHRRNKGHAVINIVSMIDMLTVLVLFLLVNSGNMQNLPSTQSVRLPESIAQKTPKETLVVAVNNEAIIAQGRKVASVPEALASGTDLIPGLLNELTHQASRSRKSKLDDSHDITIMGDKKIPYILMRKIMVTCTKAGYTNITLAVIHKAAKG